MHNLRSNWLAYIELPTILHHSYAQEIYITLYVTDLYTDQGYPYTLHKKLWDGNTVHINSLKVLFAACMCFTNNKLISCTHLVSDPPSMKNYNAKVKE